MKRRSISRTVRGALAPLVLAVLLGASLARADDAALAAVLVCAPAAGPGRIVCELTTHATTGKLVWVDALVVKAPPFARPLRSRVVAEARAGAELGSNSAKLALVASEVGTGELELLVRGVVCHESANGERCGPEVLGVTAPVTVGP